MATVTSVTAARRPGAGEATSPPRLHRMVEPPSTLRRT